MTHQYNISGMTCGGCETKVKSALLTHPDVLSAEVNKDFGTAKITMNQHISLAGLQDVLTKKDPKYVISTNEDHTSMENSTSFFTKYKPVLLIFIYLLIVTFAIQFMQEKVDFMQWMRHFMAGFFLVFSFFKLLNISGFAESYSMYDILAKNWKTWGFLYPFVELMLGIFYLINFNPIITNSIALVVMSVSIIGVLQSVLSKNKIQCACLGDVFDLPMSTITIIEDALMIVMSATMLIYYLN